MICYLLGFLISICFSFLLLRGYFLSKKPLELNLDDFSTENQLNLPPEISDNIRELKFNPPLRLGGKEALIITDPTVVDDFSKIIDEKWDKLVAQQTDLNNTSTKLKSRRKKQLSKRKSRARMAKASRRANRK